MRISRFIGRQLSRLKAGQSFYMIVISTITALGIVKMVWEAMPIWMLIALFPVAVFGAFLLGYIMDKSNIISMDQQKTIEMTHRYLNTGDFKYNEFYVVIMKSVFKWMESIQKGEPIDFKEFDDEYKKYVKEWDVPKGNT